MPETDEEETERSRQKWASVKRWERGEGERNRRRVTEGAGEKGGAKCEWVERLGNLMRQERRMRKEKK